MKYKINLLFCICFSENNKIFSDLIHNNIYEIKQQIENLLFDYNKFIHDIFYNINTLYLSSSIYNTKNLYIAQFNALITRLEIEIDIFGNKKITDKYNNYIIKYNNALNIIHNMFVIKIRILNKNKYLKIEKLLIYSKSFRALLDNTNIP